MFEFMVHMFLYLPSPLVHNQNSQLTKRGSTCSMDTFAGYVNDKMFCDKNTKLIECFFDKCFLPGTPLPKDFKADFLFVVDSSQSINQEKFQRELDFVKAFARTLNIAPDKSRIGVITFGDSHALSVQFDDYNNIKSLLRGVDAVPKISGEKRLDEALYFAARVLSQVKDRTDSHKILVVLTDGKQPLGRNSLNDAARLLKQIGVKVIIVGVGGNVDIKVLETITSRLDDLFYSRSFEELIRQVPVITDHVLVSCKLRKSLND